MRRLWKKVKRHREARRLMKVYTVKHGEMLEAYNQILLLYVD